MNVVALIGNVAAEPELRHTTGGRAVCTFRLAVSRPGGTEADFFTIVAWERQAEVCNEYVSIGRRIGVEGRLHHSTWEVDGTRRSKVEVIAHRVQLLGAPKRAQSAAVDGAEAGASEVEDAVDAVFGPADEREAAKELALV